MVLFTVLFVATISVITVGMFYGARWASGRLHGMLVARMQAGESIVNNAEIPASWIAPHRKRIERMRAAGRSDNDIQREALAAQKDCIRRLDDLITFFDQRRVTASPEAQHTLMSALRRERARWVNATWQDFISGNLPPAAEQ